MALSDRTKEIMVVALADRRAGSELSAAVDTGSAGADSADASALAAAASASDASDSADAAAASAAAIDDAATAVSPLGMTVSNPPTQVEVQAIADKVDELIAALAAIVP